MQEYSLKRELARTFIIAVAASALLASSVVAWYAGDRFRSAIIKYAQELTENFANRASLAILTRDKQLLADYVKSVLQYSESSRSVFPQIKSVLVTDPQWQVLFRTEGAELPEALREQTPDTPNKHTLWSETRTEIHVLTTVTSSGDSNLHSENNPDRLFGHLMLSFDRRGTDDFVNAMRIGGGLSGTAFGGVLLIWLRFKIRRLMAPLTTLVGTMAGAGGQAAGIRAQQSGPSELQEIASAFNFMMDKIERAQRDLEDAVKKATSEATIAQQLAENESRAKSDLLTRVSHEFRQPLNNILAYTETLLHKLRFVAAPVDDLKDDVGRVLDNAKRLTRLVDDLLLVRKMAQERLRAQFTSFPVRDLLREVIAEVQPICDARENSLTLRFSGAEHFLGDREKTRIVLSNLLGNSVKFTESGTVDLDVKVTTETLIIRVLDTGIGIEPEAQAEVFQMFHRGSPDRVRGYQGVGVGLWIVKELVTLMDGEVSFSSEPNLGSCFVVLLPTGKTASEVGTEQPRHMENQSQSIKGNI